MNTSDQHRLGSRRAWQSRPAFTLLEILLVLSLLVIIGALVLPSVGRPLEGHRLRKSADLIRAQFARARARAMDTGRTYIFRYQPAGDAYFVQAWYSDEDLLESNTLSLTAAPAANANLLSGDAGQQTLSHLPESVTFVTSQTDQQVRELMAESSNLQMSAGDGFSDPIFFYPDGTSSTAQLLVGNREPRYIMLTLRGLTGVVYVSDMLTMDQVQ